MDLPEAVHRRGGYLRAAKFRQLAWNPQFCARLPRPSCTGLLGVHIPVGWNREYCNLKRHAVTKVGVPIRTITVVSLLLTSKPWENSHSIVLLNRLPTSEGTLKCKPSRAWVSENTAYILRSGKSGLLCSFLQSSLPPFPRTLSM